MILKECQFFIRNFSYFNEATSKHLLRLLVFCYLRKLSPPLPKRMKFLSRELRRSSSMLRSVAPRLDGSTLLASATASANSSTRHACICNTKETNFFKLHQKCTVKAWNCLTGYFQFYLQFQRLVIVFSFRMQSLFIFFAWWNRLAHEYKWAAVGHKLFRLYLHLNRFNNTRRESVPKATRVTSAINHTQAAMRNRRSLLRTTSQPAWKVICFWKWKRSNVRFAAPFWF